MEINRGLILKGGAGLAATAAVATGVSLLSMESAEEGEIKVNERGLIGVCELDEKSTSKECAIDKNQLKKIGFSNKGSGDLTIGGEASGMKLVIKKIKSENENDDKEFPTDLKFAFTGFDSDVTIGGSDGKNIVLKKGTNPEFKLVNGRLERGWTTTELAEEAGLKCPMDDKNSNKCFFNSAVRVFENNKKSDQLVFKSGGKFEFSENQPDYNQGLRLKVIERDIILNETGYSATPQTLAKDSCYELKYLEDNLWYLSKKSSCE